MARRVLGLARSHACVVGAGGDALHTAHSLLTTSLGTYKDFSTATTASQFLAHVPAAVAPGPQGSHYCDHAAAVSGGWTCSTGATNSHNSVLWPARLTGPDVQVRQYSAQTESQQPVQQPEPVQQSSADSLPRATGASIDPREAAKFAALAGTWWHPDGPFAPLHALNPARCKFIRTAVCNALQLDSSASEPLFGLAVLDVGCGGGILSESLARMGARVTGIDVSEENICVARGHARMDPDVERRVRYECMSAESLAAQGQRFDVVVASEVIEHVKAPDAFLATLASLLREEQQGEEGGQRRAQGAPPPSPVPLIVSTINRTPASFALAILAAEHVLRVVPKGTHNWEKFITPSELALMARNTGLQLSSAAGITLQGLAGGRWGLSTDLSVNYIAMLQRAPPPP